jgi:hypothetical protein
MRVIYADPGLRDDLGHHANSCRTIRRELARRGVTVMVLAFAQVTQALREELHAMPFFRAYTYWQTDGDPVAGWLNSFDSSVRATIQDLQRLQGVSADDIVYLNSAQPAQFMALVQWVQSRPTQQRPHVVMELGTDPGIDVTFASAPDQPTLHLRDYRTDPRPMFYRHAACQLTDQDLARFHMITFDPTASAIYTTLLGRPVGVLPLPQTAAAAVTPRTARRPLTVSVLGHQRPDKGYHLMPQIARQLLAHEPAITLLVHNGAPGDMAETQAELRAQAATNPSLVLNEQVAGPALWQDLLNQSDLILCPYEPARFAASYSAVATEAVANAIPLVVPANTTLSRLLQRYGKPGATFHSYDPAGIVAATRHALANFDPLATRAAAAADQWNTTMGVGNMVNALLAKAAT